LTYKVTKLTRKYNGFGYFRWVIQPTAWDNRITRPQLHQWRCWCWETWGYGAELSWSLDTGAPWAWDTEYDHKRIYLRDDAELAVFQLKWQR